MKRNIRFWQRIFIEYESKDQYWVYNPSTGKVDITRHIFIDKQHLDYQEALHNWDYIADDWTETDDAQFTNIDDFTSLDIDNSPYSIGKITSKLPKKEANDS